MKNQAKSEDLGVVMGNDDMVFWQQIIDSRKIDISTAENNLKYFKAILELAEERYKVSKKEFENAH